MERSPAVALWGNSSCFHEATSSSYDSCCSPGHIQLFHSSPSFVFSCKNPLACAPTSCPRADFKACCETQPLTTAGHWCLKGCETDEWRDFLRAFRLARGCLHCLGRLDMLQMAREVMRSSKLEAATDCAAGHAVAAFTVLLASAVSTSSHQPVRSYAGKVASALLEQISFCKLSSMDWWHLTGLSDVQMRYVLAQMEPVPFLASSFVRFKNPDFEVNSSIIDVGAGGFGDTLYFLARQMRVLAVDARPFSREPWMKRLPRGRLEMVSRAVSTGPERLVPVFVDEHGQGLMTSVNASLVPGATQHELHRVMVPSASCSEILSRQPAVVYMKVDVEGQDLDCVHSLNDNVQKLPRFFSIELPPADKALELVKALEDLGYTRFKIVRQRLYNCRLIKGQRYASSGPYGEEAVDFLRGPAGWRVAAEVTREVLKLVTWERSRLMEWFDLHAKL